MKIIVTADIHYGVGNNEPIVKKFAQRIIRTKADVLILVGDTYAIDQKLLVECLELFQGFKGDKLLVAGNHDLWTTEGSSLTIYGKVIPKIAKKCGFHFLDQKPFIKGGVGFVGSIGWYDYSFRDLTLSIPKQYYLEKRWPEVVNWNDRSYVRLGMSDEVFTKRVNQKLKRHFRKVNKQVSTIICATHLVPFYELLRTTHTSIDKFLNGFSGSEETGRIIKSFLKVKYVFCGHTHQKKEAKIGDIICVNIGSDYLRKRYEMIDI